MSKTTAKVEAPKNVKCNCGHTIKDHYRGGWCHSSGHINAGQCGCTFFYPNDEYVKKKILKVNNKLSEQCSGATPTAAEELLKAR